jgi:hypothetical protein
VFVLVLVLVLDARTPCSRVSLTAAGACPRDCMLSVPAGVNAPSYSVATSFSFCHSAHFDYEDEDDNEDEGSGD